MTAHRPCAEYTELAKLEAAANAALDALRRASGVALCGGMSGADLLHERTAELGRVARERTSANGSCRLLRAADGWLALNLARDEDVELVPAWLEEPNPCPTRGLTASWDTALDEVVRGRAAADLVARGRLLGLPIARVGEFAAAPRPYYRLHARSTAPPTRTPLVVDLSSLWAGPLCSHLLHHMGARVIKVESRTRPDTAREGTPRHFARLNAGKQQRLLDFHAERDELERLLSDADVVIESARPRAMRQLGIDVERCVTLRPGKLWISITGYGRAEPAGLWVAFGDDAAAAAGAVRWTDQGPEFVADAVADPLTGLYAALAATECLAEGVGGLLELSLAGVTAHCLAV